MRCARLISLFVGSVAVASAAQADGYNWSGLYLGAHAGYAWGDVSVTDTDGGVNPGPFNYSPDGGFGGGTIGANLQLDSIVVGVEGDLGYLDLSGSSTIPSSDPNYHQDLTIDGGFYAVAAGRLGISFGQTLLYAKGGYAYFDGEAKQATTKAYYSKEGTGSFSGWALGGGVEHAIGGGWSIKAEYLHFDFGKEGGVQEKAYLPTLPEPDDGTLVGDKFHNQHDLEVDTVKVGINYKFGERREPVPLK